MPGAFDTGEVSLASGPALTSFHYAFPITVFVYYIVTSAIAVCTLQTKSSEEAHGRQRLIQWLLLFAVLSYLAQLVGLLAEAIIKHTFPLEQDMIICLLSCILVFGVEFAGLTDTPNPVWHPIVGSMTLALVFEPIIAGLSLTDRLPGPLTSMEIFEVSTSALRYLAFALSILFYFEVAGSTKKEEGTDSERQSLLQSAEENGQKADQANGERPNGYGAATDADSNATTDANQTTASTETAESPWEKRQREAREQMEKRLKEKGNWFTYAKSFLVCLSDPACVYARC